MEPGQMQAFLTSHLLPAAVSYILGSRRKGLEQGIHQEVGDRGFDVASSLVPRAAWLSLLDFEAQTHKPPMAPFHIRKYQESDRPRVLDLFSKGAAEHAPITFRHLLRLPQALVPLLGGPLALLLVSGSWLLALVAGLALLAALRVLAKYPWSQYVSNCLRTDMCDISKTYLSAPGSCFWVAECEGQVVGTVAALPVGGPGLRKEQLELFRLSVSWEHRGQGIARALVRTVLQFARDQGCSEVVLSTSMLQYSALALYQSMGFRKTGQHFPAMINRITAIHIVHLTYLLPSAQDSEAPGQ